MLRYFIQRVLVMVPTLLIISFLIFVIIQAPPGDFLETTLAELQARGENMDQNQIENLRALYGLDQPFHVQYLRWLFGQWDGLTHLKGGLIFGDLGYSFEYNQPVSDIVGDRLALTVIVSIASILFVSTAAWAGGDIPPGPGVDPLIADEAIVRLEPPTTLQSFLQQFNQSFPGTTVIGA